MIESTGMRTFIAIEIPEEVRKSLQDFQERLRKNGLHASWVKPELMHLTLRFLGDITEEQRNALASFLKHAYDNMLAPTLLTRGIGAFPSIRKPSVVWAGIEALTGELDALQQIAEAGAREIGVQPETKAFHGHVTLARIRKRDNAPLVSQLIAPYLENGMSPEFGHEFRASNVVLFSSTLTPKGPIHRKVQEFPLL